MPTKIEWVKNQDGLQGHTWNVVTGCTKVSPGCVHCYAERMARRLAGRHGYPAAPNHFDVTLRPDRLSQPLSRQKPTTYFVCSMSDLFHKDVPDEFIDKVFAVMALGSQHTFQCLSKRPSRMAEYFQSQPLARIAALVYNVMHGQGTDIAIEQPIRDRIRRNSVACRQAARQGRQARGRLLQGSDNQSLPESEGRISTEAGLLISDGDNKQSPVCGGGTPPGMDTLQRTNPDRLDNQSQERYQGRQQTRKPRASNDGRTTQARLGCAESEAPPPYRIEASQDAPDRSGCNQNPGAACRGGDGKGHSSTIPDEPQGYISNLLSQDLETYLDWPLPNVWLGVSCENQAAANERIPLLLQIPAEVRFVSAEPLLGPIDFSPWIGNTWIDCLDRAKEKRHPYNLDQIIVGGESGPGARPMHPAWPRNIRDQCAATGTPFFFKSWGAWAHIPSDTKHPLPQQLHWWPDRNLMGRVGKGAAGRLLDGREHNEMPTLQGRNSP